MRGRVIAPAVVGLLVVAVVAIPAIGAKRPAIAVTSRLGPDTMVAPQAIGDARANCPGGWVAIAGGSFAGAIEHVVDGRTPDRRGWFVSGFNPSTTTPYSHSVQVICQKGNSRVRVRTAVSAQRKAKAKRDFLEARR